ncbi:MAG: lipoate---protein ligase [Clostridiales bacterium]|nr:lipoate---protein ligase [Clostridiales bacterium]
MVTKIQYIEAKGTNPYENLALEEYLLDTVEKDACILYLWQNQNTVVIGRNQNPWKECKSEALKEDGGYLVRRLSGGGAVFHDLGNLNFTFLVHKENYDLEKQLGVILRAVNKMGIEAKNSGRNDITVKGRKFSGNAFYTRSDHCYHHGTLLVRADLERLSYYLTVSKEKLRMKGIDSVSARVGNLSDYKETLTVEELKRALFEAFEEVYQAKAMPLDLESLDGALLKIRSEHFASFDWNFGKQMEFQYEREVQFTWGNVTIQFQVDAGIIKELVVYSDAVEADFIAMLPDVLRGARYEKKAVLEGIKSLPENSTVQAAIKRDLISFLAAGEW